MSPHIHAIFFRQIAGDEALLRLAQTRFRQAGVLPEFYPASPDELTRELPFRPFADRPISIHLPRDIRLLEPRSADTVCAFAARFAREAAGMVVHDQAETASRFEAYVVAVREIDSRLQQQGPGPMLFIEYAAGIPTEAFATLFEAIRDCPRVSACVDISHIGIRQAQRVYERLHPGEDVCKLKWNSSALPAHIADVQSACATALPVVCQTVAAIGRLGKPMHFHLHDGHPCSTFSAYGVSDHLSFFHEIFIPFTFEGRRTLPLLYGPMGLKKILDMVRAGLTDDKLSLTIEVHPPDGRLGLGEYAPLFGHWRDKENAERMNHWIEVMLRCAALVRDACS
jgi:hypothetical protein